MRKNPLKVEVLEDRLAPAVAVAYVNSAWSNLAAGAQIADADPWSAGDQSATIGLSAFASIDSPQANSLVVLRGDHAITADSQLGTASVVTVYPPGSLEIVGDVTTNRTFNLNSAGLKVNGELTLVGAEVNGGNLSGPGNIVALGTSSFNGGHSFASLTIHADSNATFRGFQNGGTFALASGMTFTLSQFTNTSSGRIILDGTANATDFVSNGFMTVNGKLVNVGTSSLVFGGGSVTTVNRVGPMDNIGDGFIDFGTASANLNGGLMVNHGLAGSGTPGVALNVGFGGYATGSGLYVSVLTSNGGLYSPGGSPNTMAVIGGDVSGSVHAGGVFTASGTLTVADPDFNESRFQPAGGVTLYGSYTLSAAGQWVYTLDRTRPELLLVLAHAAGINDEFTARSADGTELVVEIFIS